MPDTAAGLVAELGKLLSPIEQSLQSPERTSALFAELGLPLPPQVRDAPQVISAAGAAATAIAQLPPLTAALVVAIAAHDDAAVVAALAQLAPKATDAFAKTFDVATKVKAAFAAVPGLDPEVQAIAAQLPERLVDYLLVAYLEGTRPVLARTLALAGIADSRTEPASGARPAYLRRELRLDHLSQLFDDPAALAQDLYGWGAADIDDALLLGRLGELLTAVNLPATYDPTAHELSALIFRLRKPPTAPGSLDLELGLSDLTGVDQHLPIGRGGWTIHLTGHGALALGAGLRITPPLTVTPLQAGVGADATLKVALERGAPGGAPFVLFGDAAGTRFEATSVSLGAGARFVTDAGGVTADLLVHGGVANGNLVVDLGGADGFLSSILPEDLRLQPDLDVQYSEATGITFRGGAGLALTIPIDLPLGPARLDRLDLAFRIATTGLTLESRLTGGATIGPFSAVVEGVGAGVDLLFHQGNLGPADLALRFLPPRGLGLSIDAPAISGGGFIGYDESVGRYSGLLDLKLGGTIGVSATGLLDTQIPGHPGEYALLVVLRATFPPIQIGFGFALSSVGGLLGLNRRVDVDALRGRFATGTVGRILAPEDPVRNAPVLFADLAAVFPPAHGVVVVGPTLQLSWVEIVRADLGIFIELPQIRIILLGSARMVVPGPGDTPLAQIRLDIIGLLDIGRKVLEFDAVLIDSQLMQILRLTGGAAFRLSWGAEPYVVLSVGGFHPAWNPAPLVFPPSLTRIAMVRGTPSDFLYFRFEGYFAITTNSIQFGASVELIINAGPIYARGFLGFDALIVFKPFSFRFDIHASVRVRLGGITMGGVDLDGTLTGPGPLVLHGRVSIELLFFSVSWEDTFVLGSSAPQQIPAVPSAVAELVGELAKPANLHVEAPAGAYGVLTPPDEGVVKPVLPPGGRLTWIQKRAPLDLLLQRFESAPLATPETVHASGPEVTGPAQDWYAPGSYTIQADAQLLNQRAFLRLNGGVQIGLDGVESGHAVTHVVTVEQIRIPQVQPLSLAFIMVMPAWLQRAARARAGHVEKDAVTPAVGILNEAWSVLAADGSVLADAVSEAQAHQLAVHGGVAAAAVPATDRVPAMAI
jgi:hypothetical protein